MKNGYVSNEGLRREFERRNALGWVTTTDVAVRLGWVTAAGQPDTSRVQRRLGLAVSYRRDGRPRRQETVTEELAGELARAIGADPWECDL